MLYVCRKAWRMCVQYVGTLRKCVLCLWKQFDSACCLHGDASNTGVLCVGTLLEGGPEGRFDYCLAAFVTFQGNYGYLFVQNFR